MTGDSWLQRWKDAAGEVMVPEPFWSSPIMRGESLFFVAPASGGLDGLAPAARLLFPPGERLSLTSVDGEVAYEPERDFVVDRASGVLTLTASSRIPFTTREELYPAADRPAAMIQERDAAETDLLWSDAIFHWRQTLATYAHAPGLWRGYSPPSVVDWLPRARRRLRARAPLTMCVTGDSISEGYNASGFMQQAPYQPPYATLVASGLESACGSRLTLHNRATSGHGTDNGVWEMDDLGALGPDLVIIAYGMNDAGYLDAAGFSRNIAQMIDTVRRHAPEAEFILVSSMLPHPEWRYPVMTRFGEYRDALAALCGPGTALADMTALWTDLLTRKSSLDLSGNGVNHPNDFGHRLYAQVVTALLVDSDQVRA
jgi:acyl-CoA thioesterase I